MNAAVPVRLIAYYLPQFHPIPENDEWWGKGFTEWTNTAKAKPMFRGHYQPHIPADLGFYDLRVPETRLAQAEMAKTYGITGFCYYHYWFGGRRILEKPFQAVLESGQPDFPFCLCWANQTWTGIWHGAPNRILIEQTYPGDDDHKAHFETLLPAFRDPRYLRVDNKPIFVIFKPDEIPNPKKTLSLWQDMAAKAGLPGLHFVAVGNAGRWNPLADGFDAMTPQPIFPIRPWISRRKPLQRLKQKYQIARGMPTIHEYKEWVISLNRDEIFGENYYPCLVHAWDNTPRSGKNGVVLRNSTPEEFRLAVKYAIKKISNNPEEKKLIFLKSWNEWAEGNHLEPDGHLQKLSCFWGGCDSVGHASRGW